MAKLATLKTSLLALALALLSACGSSEEISIDLFPATQQVIAGGAIDFDATITVETANSFDARSDNSVFDWTVVEPAGGTVTANGRYTAPLGTGTYHVKATSKEHPSHSATATVTVVSP